MQFGFERSSNVGNLNLGCMSDQLHTRGDITLLPLLEGVNHFWCCISVSNIAPGASVQSETSDRHFEAKQGLVVEITPSCPDEREVFRFRHRKQRLRTPIMFFCSLQQLGFYFTLLLLQ